MLTVDGASLPSTWPITHKKTSLASSHGHLRAVRREERKLQSLLRPRLQCSCDTHLPHCTAQSKSQSWPGFKGWRKKLHFLMQQVAKSSCIGRDCCERLCQQSKLTGHLTKCHLLFYFLHLMDKMICPRLPPLCHVSLWHTAAGTEQAVYSPLFSGAHLL